ncbi:MAG TPA: radical SAM protein [bacterium]|nr:radical SAM protein [bacterium]
MHICFLLDHILLQHQPLGVSYISALLKRHGHKVSALNVDSVSDPVQSVRTLAPDVVAYSTSSSSAARYQEINRILRDAIPGLFSLFGGPHPSFFPRMIDEDPGVDAICIGEGEYATLELCDRLQKQEDISDIHSLYVRTPNGIRTNPVRPFLTPEQMDNLPFPDREVVDGMGTFHGQTAFVITGRGCPFDCSYCFNHVSRDLQEGKWVRRRSVENVLEEIRWLKDRYGVVYVAFQDDTFILNRNWLREFCPKYAREIGLPFICNVRADLTDKELVDLLAEAGCIRVATGIENGDDNIRRNILAKNVTSDQYRHACDLFNSRKIRVVGQNMIGVPGETVESALSTIELNIQCRCHIAIYSFFAPFPGTKLGEMAKEYGFTGDMREIPREFQNGLAPSMRLERKELIELIGHCAHLFTSYPALFSLSKILLTVLPGDTLRASYLRLMTRLSNWMIRRNGGRLPTHWHQPRFIEDLIRHSHREYPKTTE